MEWVAISFSKGSSGSRDQTHVSCIAGRFFTTEPPGKPRVEAVRPAGGIVGIQRKVPGRLDLDGMVAVGWRELEGVEMFLGRLYKVWGWIASAYVGRREREGGYQVTSVKGLASTHWILRGYLGFDLHAHILGLPW